MSYAGQPRRPGPRGYENPAYVAAAHQVRERAKAHGLPCYFWGRPGYEDCPGTFDWTLPYQHRWAYTTHHTHRRMDGGEMIPDPALMAPAHRGCNSRDGLRAQNARRQGAYLSPGDSHAERTSRVW